MRRYWVDKNSLDGSHFTITGDSLHHIVDVCRQGLGSKFELLTEDSKAYFVEIILLNKKNALAKVLEVRQITPLPNPRIHLALSYPKIQTLEAVLEKSVELGVAEIHPFFSEFSFLRKASSVPNKAERWNKIIMGATQQTGRGDLMKLHAPVNLDEILGNINQSPSNLGLFSYEGEATLSLKEHLNAQKQTAIQHLWLFVGSEGGFSLSEVDKFKGAGMNPLTLGSQILRVETACMALVSILKYEFDLFK
jgi:16S rRNA (uracil1498-N3)-methyltransferase